MPLTVVGIGASAGGLDPLVRFLDAVPSDLGAAYVVITHLAPGHQSSLPELLAAATSMPVLEVNDEMRLEPDRVYVIPPDRELVASAESLSTVDLAANGRRSPIDHFFRSLAAEHGDSFALVLSGDGSDGSVGIRSLKEAGGIVLVQDPDEAGFRSMPRHAIATGVVDLVLPIDELAARFVGLVRARRRPSTVVSRAEDPAIQRILARLRRHGGHDFSRYKESTVLRRLQRRMQLVDVDSLSAYERCLEERPGEVQKLLQELLVSVTSFFRDREAFEALGDLVIEPIVKRSGPDRPIRVWVPGCATGEEAYSIAMLFHELASRHRLEPELEIFATDLDQKALDVGRKGRYPDVIEHDVSTERLNRFFRRSDDHYQVRPFLRNDVLFAEHNLLRDPPFLRLDLISCRNLLIYLSSDLQEQLFPLFHFALRSGGHLLLGSAENADLERFHEVDRQHRLYMKRQLRVGRRAEVPRLLLDPPVEETRSGRRKTALRSTLGVHELGLEQLAPPSVLVDSDSRVLHLSETAGRFVQPSGGPFTSDLTELIRPELSEELRSALFRLFRNGEPVLTRPVSVGFEGATRFVSAHLLPRWHEDSGELLALVLFLEGEATDEEERAESTDGAQEPMERLRRELRESRAELNATREQHESAHQELRAANQELQSLNEEHRSTTEELETSNKVLQSLNEELQAVNSELEHLMASSEIAALFLDRELRLEKHTPKGAEIFPVTEADRGRSIVDFKSSLDDEEVWSDCRRVLSERSTVEREVTTGDGRWFALRIRPYRSLEEVEGVVLTLFEITHQKQTERELEHRQAQLELAHQAAGVAWWSIDLESRRIVWSEAGRDLLGVSGPDDPQTLEGFAERHVSASDRAAFIAAFSEAGRDGSDLGLEFRVDAPDGTERWIVSRGRIYPDREEQLLHGVLIDVTEQKRLELQIERIARTGRAEEPSEDAEQSENLRAIVAGVTEAEQEERRQLAGMLHDDLQQLLYGIRLRITELLRSGETPETADSQRLTEIYDQLAAALTTTRELASRLSLPSEEASLSEVLEKLAHHMEDLHDLEVDVERSGPEEPQVPENVRIVVHQVVRELLFNVTKHSGARHAEISYRKDGQDLVVTVRDSGLGFDPRAVDRGSGLRAIRHRLELLGGRMEIRSRPQAESGVVVEVRCPVSGGG